MRRGCNASQKRLSGFVISIFDNWESLPPTNPWPWRLVASFVVGPRDQEGSAYHPDANIQYHVSHLHRRDAMLANQKGYSYYAYAMAMEKCESIGVGVGIGEACGSDGERRGQRDDRNNVARIS
jgi:hypothetical protein